MMTTTSRSATGHARKQRLAGLPRADQYHLLGVDFSLRTDSEQVRDFFRAAYRRFRVARAGGEGRVFPLVAVIGARSGGPYASAGDASIELAGRPMPENRAFLFLLNALMDRVGGFVAMHAAAVSVHGRGVVLAGPATAGKSTLVMELARRGAAFLSDDVAPLERGTGLLHAFPRAVGIRRDAAAGDGFDPDRLPAGTVHALPHKWIVDAEALGARMAGPQDAPCPVDLVVFLDLGPARAGSDRLLEIALVEEDAAVLDRLRGIPGVAGVTRSVSSPFPVFSFTARRDARPMHALGEFCRANRDVVLYLDEERAGATMRADRPILAEARWSTLLMDLARDLLNRSETSTLMASCGGLPALVSELGTLLQGARGFRLRPGSPAETADLILDLASGEGRVGMRGQ